MSEFAPSTLPAGLPSHGGQVARPSALPLWERLRGVLLLLLLAGGMGLAAGLLATGNLLGAGPIILVLGLAAGLFIIGHYHMVFWFVLTSCLFNDWLAVPIGGLNLRPYVGLAALGLGSMILVIIEFRRGVLTQRAIRIGILFAPMGFMIVSKAVTSVTVTQFPMGMPAIFPVKHLVFGILLYLTGYITAVLLPERKGLERALAAWIILAGIIAFIGLFQTIASNTIGAHWVHHRDVIFYGRAYSVFREPDVFGSIMAADSMLIFALLVFKVHVLSRRVMLGILGLCGLMLLMLFVRAAWLAAIVASGYGFVCLWRAKRLKILVPYIKIGMVSSLFGITILVLAAPEFIASFTNRIESLANPQEEGASAYRMQDLEAMAGMLAFQPPASQGLMPFFFGRGDMSWSYWAPHLIGHTYDSNALDMLRNYGIVLIHPGFCMALAITFDNGIIGLFLILLFFTMLLWKTFRLIERHRDNDRMVGLLLANSLSVLCIFICFQFSYDPISPFFWVMIGLWVATIDHAQTYSNAPDSEASS